MIGILTALVGTFAFLGGNLSEQLQNDQARINSMRNPNNNTGTYMDYRGKMRDIETNQLVILEGGNNGNIYVKDIYGVTIRVCKTMQKSKAATEIVPYNKRNEHLYKRPWRCECWQCPECGAWNYVEKLKADRHCDACKIDMPEDVKIYNRRENT